jgi:hypothetical protein
MNLDPATGGARLNMSHTEGAPSLNRSLIQGWDAAILNHHSAGYAVLLSYTYYASGNVENIVSSNPNGVTVTLTWDELNRAGGPGPDDRSRPR